MTHKINVITLEEYANIVGYKGDIPKTLEQIQEYAEDNLYWTIWDYPLDELEYCIEEDRSVVLVKTDFGLRLCEIN
jgi:hypothetical protein